MAIYSLSHKPIGKSTQAEKYTAAAHIAYITRARALHHIDAARMPLESEKAAEWLREQEDKDRANARVVDKVMLALPRELSPEQRVALVRAFAEEVSRGKASWLAAFHDNTTDAHNPHCHLVIRDRDPATGKRVIGMSEKGSTERLRVAWENHANAVLQEAGKGARIDRRTLKAQGIERHPTIHEGVRARRIVADGRLPSSRRRWYRNGMGARRRVREVNYPALDKGRTRAQVNEYWAALDADRVAREMEGLRAIHHPPVMTERERFQQALRAFRQRGKPTSDRDRGTEWEPED